jgi:hypothetical protein
MTDSVLTTIAATGFGIAFFHAAIPTHWLPFVLTARAQHWARTKTLAITALAASGHVLFTATLGVIVAWLGIALSDRAGAWFPRLAGGALILFGLFYVFRQLRGDGHGHSHSLGGGPHVHHHAGENFEKAARNAKTDFAAVVSLLALLTFSPCEAFVPVYVSGVRYGWHGFALLTIILSAGTVAGMVAFTSLALAGIKQVRLRLFEKYESVIIGALLCVVGLLIMIFEK